VVSVSEELGGDRPGFSSSAGRLIMEPVDVFFNERIEVLVVRRDHSLGAKFGVFAENGDWISFRGRFNELGWCGFDTRQPEHLIILEDREGPEIEPVGKLRLRPGDGKILFESVITDAGSGVDAATLRAFVNGETAIVAIDPDTGRVSGRSTKPLPYGQHRFRLEAEDRLGNTTSREFTVDVSR
jgi:hypothetical protein